MGASANKKHTNTVLSQVRGNLVMAHPKANIMEKKKLSFYFFSFVPCNLAPVKRDPNT